MKKFFLVLLLLLLLQSCLETINIDKYNYSISQSCYNCDSNNNIFFNTTFEIPLELISEIQELDGVDGAYVYGRYKGRFYVNDRFDKSLVINAVGSIIEKYANDAPKSNFLKN